MQRGSSYKAEVAAAYKRATYLKQLHLEELKAIRHRQIKATGTEALILQEMDKQHWATIVELNRHKAALLIANDRKLLSARRLLWRSQLGGLAHTSVMGDSMRALDTLCCQSAPATLELLINSFGSLPDSFQVSSEHLRFPGGFKYLTVSCLVDLPQIWSKVISSGSGWFRMLLLLHILTCIFATQLASAVNNNDRLGLMISN